MAHKIIHPLITKTNMTRFNDTDRENWNDDDRKRCKECGLEPEECNCDKELSEIF